MKAQFYIIVLLLSYPILFSYCSRKEIKSLNTKIYVYTCDKIKLIYTSSDSTKCFVYEDWYNYPDDKNNGNNNLSPNYHDSFIVKLFEKGIITSKILFNSINDKKDWYVFDYPPPNIKKINSRNCLNIIPDSNKIIIELAFTSKINNINRNKIYQFGVFYYYRTNIYKYKVKILNDRKLAIKYSGIIF